MNESHTLIVDKNVCITPDPETALPGTYSEQKQLVSSVPYSIVWNSPFTLCVVVAVTKCQSKAAYRRGVWFWLAVEEDTVHHSTKAWW